MKKPYKFTISFKYECDKLISIFFFLKLVPSVWTSIWSSFGVLFCKIVVYNRMGWRAGGKAPPRGFIGCMRKIAVDGNYRLPGDWAAEEYCCAGELAFDACQMIDRCNPSPCEHAGVCSQTADDFSCDCSATGYAGAVCHTRACSDCVRLHLTTNYNLQR